MVNWSIGRLWGTMRGIRAVGLCQGIAVVRKRPCDNDQTDGLLRRLCFAGGAVTKAEIMLCRPRHGGPYMRGD